MENVSLDGLNAFAIISEPKQLGFELFLPNAQGQLQSASGKLWSDGVFDPNDNRMNVHSVSKSEYIESLTQLIKKLKDGFAEKVVFSRYETVHFPRISMKIMEDLLSSLRMTYPHACIFAHGISEGKFWIGATPEVLIQRNGSRFSTVALAGTRLIAQEGTPWGNKEIREQQVVTDFILSTLKAHGASEIETTTPYTFQAGRIEHIKTDISFHSTLPVSFWIEKLHPTPAVAGLPRNEAMELVRQHESHNRGHYSGWFGYESNETAAFYVQLRCAFVDLSTQEVHFYAGGGIMPDSSPEQEWQETANKMKTLQEVMMKLLQE